MEAFLSLGDKLTAMTEPFFAFCTCLHESVLWHATCTQYWNASQHRFAFVWRYLRFGGIFSSLKLGKTWLKGYLEYAHFKYLVSQWSVNLSCIQILIANVYSVNMLN